MPSRPPLTATQAEGGDRRPAGRLQQDAEAVHLPGPGLAGNPGNPTGGQVGGGPLHHAFPSSPVPDTTKARSDAALVKADVEWLFRMPGRAGSRWWPRSAQRACRADGGRGQRQSPSLLSSFPVAILVLGPFALTVFWTPGSWAAWHRRIPMT